MELVDIYLLHFSKPLKSGARHYVGKCRPGRIGRRFAEHCSAGRGSADICRKAVGLGTKLYLVHTWYDMPGSFEMWLKGMRNLAPACPLCSGFDAFRHPVMHRPKSFRAYRSFKVGGPRALWASN